MSNWNMYINNNYNPILDNVLLSTALKYTKRIKSSYPDVKIKITNVYVSFDKRKG